MFSELEILGIANLGELIHYDQICKDVTWEQK